MVMKARVWSKVEKYFIPQSDENCDVSIAVDSEHGYIYIVRFLDNGEIYTDQLDVSDYEVTWFTGLKDKNNKDIYEGDILKRVGTFDNFSNEYINTSKVDLIVVELKVNNDGYGKSSFGFTMNTQISYSERTNPATYEIIGNIYENKDLLTQ